MTASTIPAPHQSHSRAIYLLLVALCVIDFVIVKAARHITYSHAMEIQRVELGRKRKYLYSRVLFTPANGAMLEAANMISVVYVGCHGSLPRIFTSWLR